MIKKFISGKMKLATKKDWKTEYLSPTISVKSVKWCRGGNRSHKQIWLFSHGFYSDKK